jgi:hypothetical protein
MDGYDTDTIEQIGTRQDCIDGRASYQAFYQMYPSAMVTIRVPVSPGDDVSARVRSPQPGMFELRLTNMSTGRSFATTLQGTGAKQSAQWMVERPATASGSTLPLADFSTAAFRNAVVTVDGTTSTISGGRWRNRAVSMSNIAGSELAAPGTLAGGGGAFSVEWNQAQ